MKTSLFLTVALASIASVLAAAIPGSTDMSSTTAASNVGSQQVNTTTDSTSVKAASPDALQQQDTKSVTKQEQDTKPVVKQETPTAEEEPVGEGYTPFFITSPSEGSSFAKGDMVNIQWINGIDGPFLIHLLTGKTAASMQNTNVTLRGEGTKGYYDWTVPKHLTDGIYAFKFSYKNNGKPQESYSVQFKIESPKTA